MGGFIRKPSPPKPTPLPTPTPTPTPSRPTPIIAPTAVEVAQSQQADATPDYSLNVKKKGTRATILTKNTSLGRGNIQRKTLLGG